MASSVFDVMRKEVKERLERQTETILNGLIEEKQYRFLAGQVVAHKWFLNYLDGIETRYAKEEDEE